MLLCHCFVHRSGEAVETFLPLLSKPALPSVLVETMAWVLGEYGYISSSAALPEVAEKVVDLASRDGLDPWTRTYGVQSTMKLSAQLGSIAPGMTDVMNKCSRSRDTILAQTCLEAQNLTQRIGTMKAVMPVDASCEDIEVDEEMSFLNSFVNEALAAGAKTYSPPESIVAAEAEKGP